MNKVYLWQLKEITSRLDTLVYRLCNQEKTQNPELFERWAELLFDNMPATHAEPVSIFSSYRFSATHPVGLWSIFNAKVGEMGQGFDKITKTDSNVDWAGRIPDDIGYVFHSMSVYHDSAAFDDQYPSALSRMRDDVSPCIFVGNHYEYFLPVGRYTDTPVRMAKPIVLPPGTLFHAAFDVAHQLLNHIPFRMWLQLDGVVGDIDP